MSKILEGYQEWVQEVSFDPFAGQKSTMELMYIQMGISGEAGELTEAIKKLVRTHGHNATAYATSEERAHMKEELGDIMWYIARMCNFFDVTIEELVVANMIKLKARHAHKED